MKSFLPLLSIVTLMASCSTAYKTGQTPDDVYFSPDRQQDEYMQVKDDENKYRKDDYAYEDDRYLRIKVRNRDRWSYLDDYYNDPYAYRYDKSYVYNNCCCNPYVYWNNYYNPYGSRPAYPVYVKSSVYNKPRTYNLHVFDNPQNAPANSKGYTQTSRQYNNNRTRTSSSTGNDLRTIFSGSESRSSSSSSSTSSSSGSDKSSSSSSGSSSGGRGRATKN